MLEHIKKCTEAEAKTVLQDGKWSLSIDEFYTFIATLYARAVSGEKM